MRANHLQDIAVLFFANSAMEDARQKKFFGEPSLFKALSEQTLKTIKASGLPFFHFSDTEQKGANFGERFAHAIQAIIELGFSKVITVGNDSPNLSKQHIDKAALQLSQGNSVVGPSKDGGCYLIGIHASDFHMEDFVALPWQTSSLRKALNLFILAKGRSVRQLNLLDDIDSISDLKRLSNFVRQVGLKLLQLFSNICSTTKHVFEIDFLSSQLHFSNIPFNKGSPLGFAASRIQ
ncbi:TIGR04282 family arsenosugar biosynthesis glycosyltransferase [Flagellimonas allohymeniacidonis]|uniref:DUF2064 domain-containing protein n=1 Tax=Flagellimonas allohymeniacidonis TaxID=2517819 RepID=A0A4Q8QCX1_9FLAO|nr:DUF2064 domain-containing protein [Allomuricauda hymeniacidonis]TAI47524.1 DUF2064 domain-containing protein [Allomuricauda hymeniacidonis]